jgi:hypothetical protein
MGLMDDVGGKVDDIAGKANSLLDAATGGPASGTSSGSEEDKKFIQAGPLSNPDTDSGGAAANAPGGQGNSVGLDFGIPTEFIHFGNVHGDKGKLFPHKNYDPKDSKPPLDGHAIMFRDALEREAILLFGYVSSCKTAVQDTTKQRGAVEEIGAMASNLLGGSNTTSKPDPSQLDTLLSKIKTEAGKINKGQIEYKDTHECGKQLHLIRADYKAFCKSLDDYYLKPPKSEGIGAIGDAIGSAAANIPGVGKVIGIVQRIAFKFLDLYLAAYLEVRKNHEKGIESAAHDLTIDAIKKKYVDFVPTYPVWFKKPKEEKAEDKKAEDKKDGGPASFSTDKYTKPVTDKIDETKKKVQDAVDDVYGFAGAKAAPEKTPGTPSLKAAFASLRGGGETTPDAVPGAADCIIAGLDATLSDIGGVPNFMKTVVREIMEGNISLLEDVFGRLMAKGAEAEIDSALLLNGGRKYLTDRISKAFTKLIFGMLTGDEDFTLGVPGQDSPLSAQQLLSKQLNDKLGKYVEPVLQICIGDLAGQLEKSRKKAADEKAQTMEVFLGRLPWLTAMMFRNTFFPIWNLVAEEVMGKVSPALKSALKAINDPINKARDGVDQAQEYKRRAEETKKKAEELKDKASNVSVGSSQGTKDIDEIKKKAGEVQDAPGTETEEGKKRQAERDAAAKQKDALDSFYQDNDKDKEFPVTGRVAAGEGLKVKEEIPSVLPAPGAAPTNGAAPAPAPSPAPASSPIPAGVL